jgi:hypothetical protein
VRGRFNVGSVLCQWHPVSTVLVSKRFPHSKEIDVDNSLGPERLVKIASSVDSTWCQQCSVSKGLLRWKENEGKNNLCPECLVKRASHERTICALIPNVTSSSLKKSDVDVFVQLS